MHFIANLLLLAYESIFKQQNGEHIIPTDLIIPSH